VQNNKAAWGELVEELEEQRHGLQKYVQQIDDKQAMEESLRPVLTAYLRSDHFSASAPRRRSPAFLRSLDRILDHAQKAKAYSELGVIRRFGRTQIDVDQIQELTRGTDRAYRRFTVRSSMSRRKGTSLHPSRKRFQRLWFINSRL
jgi:ribosomal protein L20A (L18A)